VTAIAWNEKTIEEFHAKKGLGVGPWRDNLLLLTAKGARSGNEITTPLVYRTDGDRYVVVASKGGAPQHPKWLHNLEANPIVEIEVATDGDTETFRAKAKPLMSGPERDRLFEHLSEVWPSFRDYQQRTERTIPVVVLERVAD